MEKEKYKFVLELIKKQLVSVKNSSVEQANQVALGLFDNEIFTNVLDEIGGLNFRFHTEKGWAKDDKEALIYDMNRIIGMIEKVIKNKSLVK